MDHFGFKISFWSPYFYSISCVRFRLLDAGFRNKTNLKKTLLPEGSGCFHPNTPIMRKREKYIDPSRLAIPIRPPGSVPVKRQPKKHRDKRAAKTWSRRSNIWTEQSRNDNPKMTTRIKKQKQTRTHKRNTTQAETPKRRRARTKKTTNPKNASTWYKLDRKKALPQAPKQKETTKKKQQIIPYSLKDSPRTWNKNMLCG